MKTDETHSQENLPAYCLNAEDFYRLVSGEVIIIKQRIRDYKNFTFTEKPIARIALQDIGYLEMYNLLDKAWKNFEEKMRNRK